VPRDLRQFAKGQECYFRLPEFCRFDPLYTVLCHFRIGGIAGTGDKAPDLCGAPGCDRCHDVIDGRIKQSIYTPIQLRAESHRAQNQWLEFLWKNEIVIVVLAA
jgi:hypothetical protein